MPVNITGIDNDKLENYPILKPNDKKKGLDKYERNEVTAIIYENADRSDLIEILKLENTIFIMRSFLIHMKLIRELILQFTVKTNWSKKKLLMNLLNIYQ